MLVKETKFCSDKTSHSRTGMGSLMHARNRPASSRPCTSLRMRFTISFLLLCCLCCSYTGHADLADDADGLLAFKNAVDVRDILKWNLTGGSGNVCEWQGVSCTAAPSSSTFRVTSLRLPGTGLLGRIPEGSLGKLAQLRVLSLRLNQLAGGLPADLRLCTFIRSIYLQHNNLSGPLPADFSPWPNLLHLDLSYNGFRGSIPPSVENLTQLKSLFLQNNSLSGRLPAINIPSLSKFSVAYNRLNGTIPDTSTYRNVTEASFLGNNLCGFPLPSCAGEAPVEAAGVGITAPSSKHHKKLSTGAIAGIVVGLFSGLLCIFLFICFLARKKGSTKDSKAVKAMANGMTGKYNGTASVTTKGGEDMAETALVNADFKKLTFFEGVKETFDLEDLLRASAEVLGKGSVGTAYKAVLESGLVVVVKRLRDVTTERREFEGQMANIGKLRHNNLVPLVAYYYSREEKLLVSEYMSNGSLSALLHGNRGVNHTPLDWDARVRIAMGAALGLDYLHEQMCTHGNIKSSNILLTKNYTSCISDYGMVQLVSATPAANRVVGYRAPEVVDLKRATQKGDVYSYGVLLLELLTAKEPMHTTKSGEGLDLPRWVQSVVKEEWTVQVFDEELTKYHDAHEEEMMEMLHIALACAAPSPDQRPSIKEVVKLLEGIRKK